MYVLTTILRFLKQTSLIRVVYILNLFRNFASMLPHGTHVQFYFSVQSLSGFDAEFHKQIILSVCKLSFYWTRYVQM